MKAMALQTPAHAFAASRHLNPKYREERKESWDLGTATHKLLLENMDESNFVIIEERDYRKKAAQQERDLAYKAKMTPILRHQYERLMEMAPVVKEQIFRQKVGSTLGDHDEGQAEVPIEWMMGDVRCRGRLDWLPNLETIDGEYIIDLKGTTGHLDMDSWVNRQFCWGIALQMAFYCQGLWEISGRQHTRYPAVMVTEPKQPYCVGVYVPPQEIMTAAERMMMAAVEKYEDCCKSGKWPGLGTEPWHTSISEWKIREAEAMGA